METNLICICFAIYANFRKIRFAPREKPGSYSNIFPLALFFCGISRGRQCQTRAARYHFQSPKEKTRGSVSDSADGLPAKSSADFQIPSDSPPLIRVYSSGFFFVCVTKTTICRRHMNKRVSYKKLLTARRAQGGGGRRRGRRDSGLLVADDRFCSVRPL